MIEAVKVAGVWHVAHGKHRASGPDRRRAEAEARRLANRSSRRFNHAFGRFRRLVERDRAARHPMYTKALAVLERYRWTKPSTGSAASSSPTTRSG